jgi:dTMP kinase
MSDPRPVWISLDGTDGTGKTTLATPLAEALGAEPGKEFSDGLLGAALRAAVTTSPNYITTSRTAQSLAFLGDFFEVYATQVNVSLRAGRSVVSDRGWLSKYAFQFVTLAEEHGAERASALLNASLGLLPRPDLTLYLTADEENIRQRLVRRDGACDEARMRFVRLTCAAAEHAISVHRKDLNCVRVDANQPVEAVLAQTVALCRSYIGAIAS